MHGWENAARKQAMSLMVFEYSTIYAKRAHFVRFLKTTLISGEAAFPAEARTGKALANPSIVAYAPFERQMEWNKTKVDIKSQVHAGANLSIRYGASAKLSGGVEIIYKRLVILVMYLRYT